MAINWSKRPHTHSGPRFITVPPDKVISPLCEPADYVTIMLHYDETQNGSFPCLQPDHCPLCPRRQFLATYAAGLVWCPRSNKWMEGILCLGAPDGTVAHTDFVGSAIVIGKEKGKGSRARTLYLGLCQSKSIPRVPEKPSFDVRPLLLRRWGLFKEADLIGCDFHPPENVLEFPKEAAS